MRFKLFFCLLVFSSAVFAWNSAGHRIVAQIAYDQLTPQAKQQVDLLTAVQFHSRYPEARFLRAATWPDQIKSQTQAYNTWHYVNLPIEKDNVTSPALNPNNVIWAITHAEKIVADTHEPIARRAKYLSFLIHFVGDIHQPLHCATVYSAHFPPPKGDRGGNLYPIVSPVANNLHALWDRGLGLLVSPPHAYQFHYDQVEQIAKQWMMEHPPSFFKNQLQETSPVQWAANSHLIAVNFVYSLQLDAEPSSAYVQQGQAIVRQQIVLAGDRLAVILNQIF